MVSALAAHLFVSHDGLMETSRVAALTSADPGEYGSVRRALLYHDFECIAADNFRRAVSGYTEQL